MDMLNDCMPLVVLAVQGLFGWALWSLRRAFVRGDEYLRHLDQESRRRQEQGVRTGTLEARLQSLEQKVNTLPDAQALADLAGAVESLRGDIKAVDMRITGVDRLMLRLERALDRQEIFLRGKAE